MPEVEKTNLAEFLKNNGWSLSKQKRAFSGAGHQKDLEDQHAALLIVENKFDGSNMKPAKRREIRAELAPLYIQLLAKADEYEALASAAYDALVDSEVSRILAVRPEVKWIYRGPGNTWEQHIKPLDPAALDARVGRFAVRTDFQETVEKKFKRIREEQRKGVVDTAAAQRRAADIAQQQSERTSVTNQLTIWRAGIALGAPGCNANGTWGTSAGGVGDAFAPSGLNDRVFNSLRGWWTQQARHADGEFAYITPSLTTTYSLKMFRPSDVNSETFNYHVDIVEE